MQSIAVVKMDLSLTYNTVAFKKIPHVAFIPEDAKGRPELQLQLSRLHTLTDITQNFLFKLLTRKRNLAR